LSRGVWGVLCVRNGSGRAEKWTSVSPWRKAAENGHTTACMYLATHMYMDQPYAREVGHVGEAAGAASLSWVMEGHDVSPDVMIGVLHWVRKGCATGQHDPLHKLDEMKSLTLEGGRHCHNDGCEVVGQLKEFKVCPQCKTSRYCGAACQKQGWNAGGHKDTCGTFACKVMQSQFSSPVQ